MDAITLAYRENVDLFTQELMDYGYIPTGLRVRKIFHGIKKLTLGGLNTSERVIRGGYGLTKKILKGGYEVSKSVGRGISNTYNYTAPKIKKAWVEGKPAREKAWEDLKPILKKTGKDLIDFGVKTGAYANFKFNKYLTEMEEKQKEKERVREIVRLGLINGTITGNSYSGENKYFRSKDNESYILPKSKTYESRSLIEKLVDGGSFGRDIRNYSRNNSEEEISVLPKKNLESKLIQLDFFDKLYSKEEVPKKNYLQLDFFDKLDSKEEAPRIDYFSHLKKKDTDSYAQNLEKIKSAPEGSELWKRIQKLAYENYEKTGETNSEKNWNLAQEKLARDYKEN